MSLRCEVEDFSRLLTQSDPNSDTIREQRAIEITVVHMYAKAKEERRHNQESPLLLRVHHLDYLLKGLRFLPDSFEGLDASRPWLCYWILQSLKLLSEPVSHRIGTDVIEFLKLCQCKEGGFAGGPGQDAHLAPTYAAMNALAILSTMTSPEEALLWVDRAALYQWLKRLSCEDGSFRLHEGGEVDIRGVYCAVSVAVMTNLPVDDLFANTPTWIASCQTYEGGYGGFPGLEAHGGYTFCALAALVMLQKEDQCDQDRLLRWAAFRQMKVEGGFQGRTNKLVDGCYSFWQGASFPILHCLMSNRSQQTAISKQCWLFDSEALQEYLIICCQHGKGGLIDKPGKPRDYYHTCYCLCGLSIAQNGPKQNEAIVCDANLVENLNPVWGVSIDAVNMALDYFGSLPLVEQ